MKTMEIDMKGAIGLIIQITIATGKEAGEVNSHTMAAALIEAASAY